MQFTVITIFPEFFDSPLNQGLLDKAIDNKKMQIDILNLRDFAKGRHRQTDDAPFGGGPGMVMMPGPLAKALDRAKDSNPEAKVIALSPGGHPLTNQKAKILAAQKGLILVCGRYEGIDQRIIDHYCDEEISIGDYVLTGGEPAALVLIDAVSRMLPGVVGDPDSVDRDSFSKALSHPQYTRPREFEGHKVPSILFSGNHEKIRIWREKAAWERTRDFRSDLLKQLVSERLTLLVVNPKKHSVVEYGRLAETFDLAGLVFVVTDNEDRKSFANCMENPKAPFLSYCKVKSSISDAVRWITKKEKKTPILIRAELKKATDDKIEDQLHEQVLNEYRPIVLLTGSQVTEASINRLKIPILNIAFENNFSKFSSFSLTLLILDRLKKV